jgi:hypothetical protein
MLAALPLHRIFPAFLLFKKLNAQHFNPFWIIVAQNNPDWLKQA